MTSEETAGAVLGAFLRSRRDALSPAQAGISTYPGQRRVPGLRKEELAGLAGVSTDHYSRIEQGRQPHLSDDLVAALARALALDDLEHAHLRDLAAPARRRTSGDSTRRRQRADPGLLRLMTSLDHVPVLLLGGRSEVLAHNALLTPVLGADLPLGSSFVRWLLTDPAARARIANWADFAAGAVAALRFEQGRHPHDAELTALVADLRRDDDVARWWDDQRVTYRTSQVKRIDHPTAGRLTFGVEAVAGLHDDTQQLVVYTVEPGSATALALPLLASWGLDEAEQTPAP